MDRNEIYEESIYNDSYTLIHHAAIDIAGDIVAGALLDRIVSLLSVSNPKEHTIVYRDGYLWLVKGRADWKDDIRVTPTQYDRASKQLVELGLIEVRKWKYDGTPKFHVRVIYDEYRKQLAEWKHAAAQKRFSENSMKWGDKR